MTALDEQVKRHDETCTCETMKCYEEKYCTCGAFLAAAELKALRELLNIYLILEKSVKFIIDNRKEFEIFDDHNIKKLLIDQMVHVREDIDQIEKVVNE